MIHSLSAAASDPSSTPLVLYQIDCAAFGSPRVCSRYVGHIAAFANQSSALLRELPLDTPPQLPLSLSLSLPSNLTFSPILLLALGPNASLLPLALPSNASSLLKPDGYWIKSSTIPIIINSSALKSSSTSSSLTTGILLAGTGAASDLLLSAPPSPSRRSCPRGDTLAGYRLLEALNFAFFKPLAPMVGALSQLDLPSLAALDVRLASPYWPVRMTHYHTQHPLELTEVLNGWGHSDPYDARSWRGMLPEVDSMLEWLVANGHNRWEFVLLEAAAWKNFSRSALRASRLQQIGARSREFCLAFGIDAPIAFLQQHSFTLVTDLSPSAALGDQLAQIRGSLDYLVQGAGIDFLGTENGLSEFSHSDCTSVLSWMNETAAYALSLGVPTVIKCHCSTGQSCPQYVSPQTQQPVNFNFLPQFATPALGVMPHTVQFYGLTDPAPVYNNQNFTYMLDWMLDMAGPAGDGRVVLYYPETEYWVDFDSSVPLFLPIYAQRRLSDLRLIARKQLLPGASPISGQNNFDSGWEWSYWLNSVLTARALYDPLVGSDDPSTLATVGDDEAFLSLLASQVTRIFGAASQKIAAALAALVQAQIQTMIFGGGQLGRQVFSAQAYIEGYDMFADFGELIPPLTVMPTRIGLQTIRHNATLQKLYTSRVYPSLYNLSAALQDTITVFSAVVDEIPENARFLFDDLFQSTIATFLRAEQVINLYDFLITGSNASLAVAQSALDYATKIVALREQGYSVPLDRVAGWRFNPTCYKYTYLWTVKSLYFWWRDEAIATAPFPVSPCFRNIQSPLQESIQFPGIDYVTIILQYIRDHYASHPYIDGITDCLDSPIKEPTYNRTTPISP